MAAYVAGACTELERSEVEEHCIGCGDCRAKLAIMLRVCLGKETAEDEKRSRLLFAPGVEAAELARWQFNDPEVDPLSIEDPSASELHPSKSPQNLPAELVIRSQSFRPYLTIGVTLAVLLTIGIVGYWSLQSRQPVENGLTALRLIHRRHRPFEARITGGFGYQPYERKRGEADFSEIDRDQFNYALAELTCAVASNPTTEARHALARLCLLINDFDRAEKQLELALAEQPNNAKLHADLATLNYERSKYTDTSHWLAKAIEHNNAAIQLDPKLAEAWFNRALCHEQIGHYADAQTDWERYLQLDPASPWTAEVREHLQKLQTQTPQ
jgi:hypothetical protein